MNVQRKVCVKRIQAIMKKQISVKGCLDIRMCQCIIGSSTINIAMTGTVKDEMTDKTIQIGKTGAGKITAAGDSQSSLEKTDTGFIVQTVSKGRD